MTFEGKTYLQLVPRLYLTSQATNAQSELGLRFLFAQLQGFGCSSDQ